VKIPVGLQTTFRNKGGFFIFSALFFLDDEQHLLTII